MAWSHPIPLIGNPVPYMKAKLGHSSWSQMKFSISLKNKSGTHIVASLENALTNHDIETQSL